MKIKGYTECLNARKNGVKYFIEGFGTLLIRRGGLSEWNRAVKRATDDILSETYSYDYVDPKASESITAKACADYTVISMIDCVDLSGDPIPDTLSSRRAVFECEENYSLVLEVIEASMQGDRFLLETVREEAEELKK